MRTSVLLLSIAVACAYAPRPAAERMGPAQAEARPSAKPLAIPAKPAGRLVAELIEVSGLRREKPLVHVAADSRRADLLFAIAQAFAPGLRIALLPAWDCLPYDRVSPHAAVVAQRMTTLSRLARVKGREKPAVLLTTVNAALQRVPARDLIGKQALSAAPTRIGGFRTPPMRGDWARNRV